MPKNKNTKVNETPKKVKSKTKRPVMPETIFSDFPPGTRFMDILGIDHSRVRKVHMDCTTFPQTFNYIDDEEAKVEEPEPQTLASKRSKSPKTKGG